MFDIELIYPDLRQKSLIVSDQTIITFIKKKTGFDETTVELIYNGNILEDDKKLLDYDIRNTVSIFVVNLKNKSIFEIQENNQLELIDTFINLINNFNHQYVNELNTLNTMGFTNQNRNNTLLTLYQGNIESVISILLEEMDM
jgi:hypothetical protein